VLREGRSMPNPLFITLLIAGPIILGGAAGVPGFLFALALVLIANPIIWRVRKNRYFNSQQFQALRSQAASATR